MNIRRVKYKTGGRAWKLDKGRIRQEDGTVKRVQLFFKTEGEALAARDAALEKQREHGDSALRFTEADRIRYTSAERQLAAVGATIEQAVAHFLRTARAVKPAIPLKPALELCIAEKENLGIKKRSLQQLRCSCLSFVRAHPSKNSNDVTREEVQEWILSNKWAPKTQRVYFGDLRAFFAWLVEKGYTTENPCIAIRSEERVKLARMHEREIEAFGFEQCAQLLFGALTFTEQKFNKFAQEWEETHVFRPLIGYAALAMFAGVRPEEVQKTPRSKIDLRGMAVVVTGKIAKTSRRRAVDLHGNAAAWVALWMGLCPMQDMIIPKNFRRLWERLRARAKLSPWPHDVLRHTFASMHFAQYKDRARLQAELGHSEDEDTLERHYKSVQTVAGTFITRTEAEKFWNLYPPPRYAASE